MGFLRHVAACNRFDLSGFRPFRVDGATVGWIRHELADALPAMAPGFLVTPEAVGFAAEVAGFAARSAAVAAAASRLVAEGRLARLHGEMYPVLTTWGAPPLLQIDRAAIVHFGIASYGLHVNGLVRQPDGGLSLWVGRRAKDRAVAPGKLDNLIGGGQPIGLSLSENLVKEAAEEAGIDRELALRSLPVGAITYVFETPPGLKVDTLFLYDLDLDPAFIPVNTDGEVERFELWPLDRVAESVRDTDDWKFNVSLVVIDFLIRHGWLTPDHPEYLDLVRGLHAPPPPAG